MYRRNRLLPWQLSTQLYRSRLVLNPVLVQPGRAVARVGGEAAFSREAEG